jgi:hypothetical protein
MSISGFAERASDTSQPISSTPASASRPSTGRDVQPQVAPLLTGSSSATSQPESSRVPAQLIRPGERIGDSGTNRCAASAVRATTTIGIQNSQR